MLKEDRIVHTTIPTLIGDFGMNTFAFVHDMLGRGHSYKHIVDWQNNTLPTVHANQKEIQQTDP